MNNENKLQVQVIYFTHCVSKKLSLCVKREATTKRMLLKNDLLKFWLTFFCRQLWDYLKHHDYPRACRVAFFFKCLLFRCW